MLVSIEVQDEERPTRPALLRSSTSHTPYSNDTSGALLLLFLLVYENERESIYWEGVWKPLYSVKRSVSSWDKHENVDSRCWDGGGDLPSKAEGAGNPSWFSRTRGSASPTWPPFSAAFGWVTAKWAVTSRIFPECYKVKKCEFQKILCWCCK